METNLITQVKGPNGDGCITSYFGGAPYGFGRQATVAAQLRHNCGTVAAQLRHSCGLVFMGFLKTQWNHLETHYMSIYYSLFRTLHLSPKYRKIHAATVPQLCRNCAATVPRLCRDCATTTRPSHGSGGTSVRHVQQLRGDVQYVHFSAWHVQLLCGAVQHVRSCSTRARALNTI